MQLKHFFNLVEKKLEYLAEGKYTFEEYLNIASKDRRVRNAVVFMALSHSEYKKRFFTLAEKSLTVHKYKTDLHRALIKVKDDKYNRVEAIKLASQLLRHFYGKSGLIYAPSDSTYEVSDEMAKFFVTTVNNYMRKQLRTPEKQAYLDKKMKDVDMNNLFLKQ